MSLIEHWERLAVLSWDRQGMPNVVRALTPGGMALRDGETEYVRADLHAGAVSPEITDAELEAAWGRWVEAWVTMDGASAMREALKAFVNHRAGGQ
jgi:hypothetical protein